MYTLKIIAMVKLQMKDLQREQPAVSDQVSLHQTHHTSTQMMHLMLVEKVTMKTIAKEVKKESIRERREDYATDAK
jgi:hypothetical protein